jgi:hypothetical protein
MGRLVADELERLAQGVPLQHEVPRARIDLLA